MRTTEAIVNPDERIAKPNLGKVTGVRELLQEFRARLDERLEPLGVTLAQLRVMWAVEANPGVSGAEVARICAMTPQSGQEALARLVGDGLVTRHPSAASERVLVAELTASGRKALRRARVAAEELDAEMWTGCSAEDLAAFETVLQRAVTNLTR